MLVDEESIEQAGLYSLGLLDPSEQRLFERKLETMPELAYYVRDMMDAAAGVALTAPAADPPPTVLPNVLASLGTPVEEPGLSTWAKKIVRLPMGWPVAACLALALVWLVQREGGSGGGPGSEIVDGIEPGASGAGRSPDDAVQTSLSGNSDGGPLTAAGLADGDSIDALIRRLEGAGDRKRSLVVIPEERLKAVQAELEQLKSRQRRTDQFLTSPGVARPVVVELKKNDGTAAPGATDHDLAQRVNDFIAAGIEKDVAPDQAIPDSSEVGEGGKQPGDGGEKPEAGQGDAKLPAPVNVEDFSAVIDLDPAETPVLFEDFPEDRIDRYAGITQLSDGLFYDEDHRMLWVRSAEPGVYFAESPPEGFSDPAHFHRFDGEMPSVGGIPSALREPGDVPQPPNFDVPSSGALPPLPPAAPDEAIPGPDPTPEQPVVFSILDEATGEGSLIVKDLPPSDPGWGYVLWMESTVDGRLVNLGQVPDPESALERIYFNTPVAGVTVSGFVLSHEPSPNVENPGSIVLQGP